jgi:putative intracellular protease/amidase
MSLKDPNVVNAKRVKRVAIVIANPAVSTTSGWPVGFWWSELTHPFYVLTEAGHEVEIFSPNGGKCDFADHAVWSMNLMPRDRHILPWRIEDELKKLGANYVQAGLWRGFAIRDGNLITGQQNFSGEETARLLIETLGH